MKPPFRQTGPVLTPAGTLLLMAKLIVLLALVWVFAAFDPAAAPDRPEPVETTR